MADTARRHGQIALDDLPALCRAVLLLDFDGTLVDLADTPDGVIVPPDLPPRLRALHGATEGAVALVSGRDLDALDRFLPGFAGPVFASHGAETRLDGRIGRLTAPEALADVVAGLADWARTREGIVIERKPGAVVVHFRRCPARADEVLALCRDVVQALPDYEVAEAKMAYELKPATASKAQAVTEMRRRHPGATVVAIGDDVTDEAMFGAGDIAIKVGEGPTCAGLRLADPAQVAGLLDAWLDWSIQ